MENKRKSPRLNTKFEIFFRKMPSILISSAKSKDVSEDGVCIPLNIYYAPESVLEVEVRGEDFRQPISTKMKVVRIVSLKGGKFPYEAGLEFLDLSPEQRGLIRAYIKRAAAQDPQNIHWEE